MLGLGTILNFLGGGIVGQIGGELNKFHQASLNAKNSSERIKADENIKRLTARKAVLIAEQNSLLTKWIRPAIAFPFAVYINKLVIWDKVLGWGTTDSLSTELHALMGVVIGGYFLVRPFEKMRKK